MSPASNSIMESIVQAHARWLLTAKAQKDIRRFTELLEDERACWDMRFDSNTTQRINGLLRVTRKMSPELLFHFGSQVNWDVRQLPVPAAMAASEHLFFLHHILTLEWRQMVGFQAGQDSSIPWKKLTADGCAYVASVASELDIRELGLWQVGLNPNATRETLYQLHQMYNFTHLLFQNIRPGSVSAEMFQVAFDACLALLRQGTTRQKMFMLEHAVLSQTEHVTAGMLEQMWDLASPEFKEQAFQDALSIHPSCTLELIQKFARDANRAPSVPPTHLTLPTDLLVQVWEEHHRKPSFHAGWLYYPPMAPFLHHILTSERTKQKAWEGWAKYIAQNPALDERCFRLLHKHPQFQTREALMKNPSVSPFTAEAFANDRSANVREAVARSTVASYTHRVTATFHPLNKQVNMDWLFDEPGGRERFSRWAGERYPDFAGLPIDMLVELVSSQIREDN